MVIPPPKKMSSIPDLISFLKSSFRASEFSRVEKELLSLEEKLKREIELQRNEIKKLLEDRQVDRLDKINMEKKLKESQEEVDRCHRRLEELDTRVLVVEKELANLKSEEEVPAEEAEKEAKTEAAMIASEAIPGQKHQCDGRPLSEVIVEIVDSDEECPPREMNVKETPKRQSVDSIHLTQTVCANDNGVLKRKRASVIGGEGNENGDSHNNNQVAEDKCSDYKNKKMKVQELIHGLYNSPMNHLSATTKSQEQDLQQKKEEFKYRIYDSDSEESSSSSSSEEDDADADLILGRVFLTKAQENMDRRKWNSDAEMIAALKKDGELCMKAIIALYRHQNNSREKAFDSSNSVHRGFDKLYTERVMILSKFLTAGSPEGKLKKSISDLNAYDPKGLDDCRKIAIVHAEQLVKISQQNENFLL